MLESPPTTKGSEQFSIDHQNRSVAAMEIVPFYQTTVIARESDLAAQLVVVPRQSMKSSAISQDPVAVRDLFGIASFYEIPSPRFLPYAIASVLSQGEAGAAIEQFGQLVEGTAHSDEEVLRFAEYVAFARLTPLKESPLAEVPLASILEEPTVLGVGLLVGIAAAGGLTPLVMLTVPAGIVLVGAADALAKEFPELVRGAIRKLLGPNDDTIRNAVKTVGEVATLAGISLEPDEFVRQVTMALVNQGWPVDETTIRNWLSETDPPLPPTPPTPPNDGVDISRLLHLINLIRRGRGNPPLGSL